MTRQNTSLTDKQRAWIVAYVGPANLNATEAARVAGYSDASTSGHQCKRHPVVRAEVERILAEVAASKLEVLAAIAKIAFDPGESAKDRLKALELLGKAHAAFTERVEQVDPHHTITVVIGGETQSVSMATPALIEEGEG